MQYKSSETCQIKTLPEILDRWIGYKTDGIFIDVGAHDGYSWSNTWGLAEAGWEGYCFEPDKELATKCLQTHANASHHKVMVFPWAIGATAGIVDLYVCPNELPSTDVPTVNGISAYKAGHVEHVPMITLDHELEAAEVIPGTIDVVSIDVEGGELDVLKGFDLRRWHPQMVIIECPDMPKRSLHVPQIRQWMWNYLYVRIYKDGTNDIYVPSSRIDGVAIHSEMLNARPMLLAK